MANRGQFKPGQSGNSKGKPKGARHKTTLAVSELLDGEAEVLTRKAIELAMDGDTVALRLCLERIAPRRTDSPVSFPTVLRPARPAHLVAVAARPVVAAGDLGAAQGPLWIKLRPSTPPGPAFGMRR